MEFQYRQCPICQEWHSVAGKRSDSHYCSDACRQKAYRQRHAEPISNAEKRQRHAERILASKRNNVHEMACSECGRVVLVDGTDGNQRYCSNACKQRAYRKRLAGK
jgi:endogenous inhibitor of DNA gyrase (YacG/DUF329 family)